MATVRMPTPSAAVKRMDPKMFNRLLQQAVMRRSDLMRRYGQNPQAAQEVERYYQGLVKRINQMFLGQQAPTGNRLAPATGVKPRGVLLDAAKGAAMQGMERTGAMPTRTTPQNTATMRNERAGLPANMPRNAQPARSRAISNIGYSIPGVRR